ncbi:hypothetical protein DFJ58DRAFT_733490 [Suillus subalutaceus]|uniref:uncharacterized protein n=1 Tax=Suillus subalutaceus TaxID=48586 RepID=UPI001B877AAD|nr:uncharacterized protein DFJ58DRAFT_733490 [Suillus subalutaceus]KAG1839131.1 hypothetical protein DFJ58DRAFT_733490 [Suillus subalutaceus]
MPDLTRLPTHPFPAAQSVIGTNGREVLATATKLDAPQNTNMVPLRVATSAAAVPQPQTKHLQEDRPPPTKVPATLKDPPMQNKAPITARATSDIKEVKDTHANLSELWDGWPDGSNAHLFSWEEAYQTDFLMEHWANRNRRGDKGRSDDAQNWQDGFRTWRACLGIIVCDEPTCQIITRPATRKTTLISQLHASCVLIGLPRLEDIQHLPIGRYLQQQGSQASSTGGYTVKYCGDLTAVQQAQVAHWIFDNIEEAQETVVQWLGCAAFAHALSVMLACNKRSILEADPDYPRDGTTDCAGRIHSRSRMINPFKPDWQKHRT